MVFGADFESPKQKEPQNDPHDPDSVAWFFTGAEFLRGGGKQAQAPW
jgi:hypothetical protein